MEKQNPRSTVAGVCALGCGFLRLFGRFLYRLRNGSYLFFVHVDLLYDRHPAGSGSIVNGFVSIVA